MVHPVACRRRTSGAGVPDSFRAVTVEGGYAPGEARSASPQAGEFGRIATRGGVLTPLISRGAWVPCDVTEGFTTADDNQPSIKVNVFHGRTERVATPSHWAGSSSTDAVRRRWMTFGVAAEDYCDYLRSGRLPDPLTKDAAADVVRTLIATGGGDERTVSWRLDGPRASNRALAHQRHDLLARRPDLDGRGDHRSRLVLLPMVPSGSAETAWLVLAGVAPHGGS
jgi:hypothetical protein